MNNTLDELTYFRDEVIKETRTVFNGCFEDCIKQVNAAIFIDFIKEGGNLDITTKTSFQVGIYVWREALEKIIKAYNAKDYRYKLTYSDTLFADTLISTEKLIELKNDELKMVDEVSENVFKLIYIPALESLIKDVEDVEDSKWSEDATHAFISGVIEPASVMGFAKSVNDYIDIYNSIYKDDTLTYEYMLDIGMG